MSGEPLTIAVTGLNATDNPGPGVPVLRSLRDGARARERHVGLTYDALDPGVYTRDLADRVFLLTYPSAGARAFLDRLTAIHARTRLDVIIPTLDAELPLFIALEPELRAMGIGLFLPSLAQLELRGKARLAALGQAAGVDVPATAVVTSVEDIVRAEAIGYPMFVKGPFYGATLVTCRDEAIVAFYKTLASWGGPVILQASVRGEEVNLVGVGDGEGGLLGPVVMKKLALTDKGKGWAGVTIRDDGLVRVASRIVAATRWRGPLEVEALRTGPKTYQIIEINPRFPAWVHLATGAGVDLPRLVVDLARGEPTPALGPYQVGKLFVRISLDQVVDMHEFERIVTTGEIAHTTRGPAALDA
jgi:carbamoyl-phosphate synthase large subunit